MHQPNHDEPTPEELIAQLRHMIARIEEACAKNKTVLVRAIAMIGSPLEVQEEIGVHMARMTRWDAQLKQDHAICAALRLMLPNVLTEQDIEAIELAEALTPTSAN